MVNSVLTSAIPPLSDTLAPGSLATAIKKYASESIAVDIAVGYVSVAGLDELNKIVQDSGIQRINLIIGMYYISGIPESIYLKVRQLQDEWRTKQIGSIWLVTNMQYHGKLYLFHRSDGLDTSKPYKAVIGSANLSILENIPRRQYEIGTTVDDETALLQLLSHVEALKEKCSVEVDDVAQLQELRILSERIEVLDRITDVVAITPEEVEYYKQRETPISFRIPIKAPTYEKRFSGERRDFARSNINVCYGRGRRDQTGQHQPRDWYEVQITVSHAITRQSGYPVDRPFWVITDDGYKFEAHTTAQNHKQLTAYVSDNNDKVFGRWIKGRLATAGYVNPVDDVRDDVDRQGVITAEMLDSAGMRYLVLTKTNLQETGRLFPSGTTSLESAGSSSYKLRDVWTVRFSNEGV